MLSKNQFGNKGETEIPNIRRWPSTVIVIGEGRKAVDRELVAELVKAFETTR